MKWMKERDLLIAQTMAFVQSVTGKRPDIETLTAAPAKVAPLAVPPANGAPQPTAPKAVPETSALTETKPAAETALAVPSALPVPTVFEVPPAVPHRPAAPTTAGIAAPAPPPDLPHFAKLDIRGDFQSEVRSRVANFRANQQRFLKEREEYCSSTMAKVRAAISELPRSDK
ncbi:hypothetical protein IC762_22465 [Bradyrhizobium genosp. L]|uniref:hypothetical protein n=1 Tax=Bradyrhizobium genosp. L TaxID=83637 RepID=UPI0018A2C83E|nr:hypothetical protein [Bradyrhizobium genosp. L]QPF82512.1 hypothetical protein IC762_22465 [Bradyrhizobium genosp. L]